MERVIAKSLSDNSIPINITDTVRASFSSKLWRMGKHFASLGTTCRKTQLEKWARSDWSFSVGESEVIRQVLSRKYDTDELDAEITKRRCLEKRVEELQNRVQIQEKIIRGKDQHKEYLKKPLEECTRQQQLTRKKKMVEDIKDCLRAEGYEPLSIEATSKAGHCEVFDLQSARPLSGTQTTSATNFEKLRSSLYVKDKFGVSFEAFHELSMLSDLPSSSQVRKLTTSLNSQFKIKNTPNNITGVQQSIKERIEHRLKCLIQRNSLVKKPTLSTIRVKLTGDGTQIGRGLKVVNIAFTVIDEGGKGQFCCRKLLYCNFKS